MSRGRHEAFLNLYDENDFLIFQTWDSFDVVSSDTDLDGIEDDIDGTFNGEFTDMSEVFSAEFTDQHIGGSTHGTILIPGDNDVSVYDDPANGLILSASGGAGFSLVQLCGPVNTDIINVVLTAGDEITAACGSLTAEVVSGPVELQIGVNVEVTIPAGGKAFIEQLPGSLVSITNLSGPGGPEIVVEDETGPMPIGPDDPPLVAEVDDGLPAAPQDLIGRAKRSKVNLRWPPVDGANSYDVFRSTMSGGPYEMVGSVTGNVFIDSGLPIGTTWYYVVQSVNGIGNSENSNEVPVTGTARRRR